MITKDRIVAEMLRWGFLVPGSANTPAEDAGALADRLLASSPELGDRDDYLADGARERG